MGFLRRKESTGSTKQLEKALHIGLARYGDRRKVLVPWILTGSPANPDLSRSGYGDEGKASNDQVRAMLDADDRPVAVVVPWRRGICTCWPSTSPSASGSAAARTGPSSLRRRS